MAVVLAWSSESFAAAPITHGNDATNAEARTDSILRERAKVGYAIGVRIFGYRSVREGDYFRRVVDKGRAKVIVEVFKRYADGNRHSRSSVTSTSGMPGSY